MNKNNNNVWGNFNIIFCSVFKILGQNGFIAEERFRNAGCTIQQVFFSVLVETGCGSFFCTFRKSLL